MVAKISGGELIQSDHKEWHWRTREGELIPVSQITDAHLRNIALFLMGMGYQECIAPKRTRILWLTVLKMEWTRRMEQKDHNLSALVKWSPSREDS